MLGHGNLANNLPLSRDSFADVDGNFLLPFDLKDAEEVGELVDPKNFKRESFKWKVKNLRNGLLGFNGSNVYF